MSDPRERRGICRQVPASRGAAQCNGIPAPTDSRTQRGRWSIEGHVITVVRRWRVDTMDEQAECLVSCSDPQAGEAAISRVAADLEEAGSALAAFEKGALGGFGAARAGPTGATRQLKLP